METSGWEKTSRGGLRRTGVAQVESAAQMKQRSVGRNHPPVLRTPRRLWVLPSRRFSLEWANPLGLPECPYVVRWMFETPVGSVRVHHWLGPDDDRARHDHPWWFVTFVLRGFYTDVGDSRWERMSAGKIRFRPALHRHTVVPGPDGCWTFMVTGPRSRAWGFWYKGKFVKANKWFARHGHHVCEESS